MPAWCLWHAYAYARSCGADDPLHCTGANAKLPGNLEDPDLLLTQRVDFRLKLWIVIAWARTA
jgi:hypothetical protein